MRRDACSCEIALVWIENQAKPCEYIYDDKTNIIPKEERTEQNCAIILTRDKPAACRIHPGIYNKQQGNERLGVRVSSWVNNKPSERREKITEG